MGLIILALPVAIMVYAGFWAVRSKAKKGIIPLFQRLTDPATAPTIAILMTGLALAVAVAYAFVYWLPIWISLKSVADTFNSIPDRNSFANELPNVQNKLESNRLVGHSWNEFRKTLVKS